MMKLVGGRELFGHRDSTNVTNKLKGIDTLICLQPKLVKFMFLSCGLMSYTENCYKMVLLAFCDKSIYYKTLPGCD